jgi:ketosteroid isomerase-like protein
MICSASGRSDPPPGRRHHHRGTHTGPLVGPADAIPATGPSFSYPFCDVLQARDGTFIAHRIYWDNATFLGQLGLMPAG